MSEWLSRKSVLLELSHGAKRAVHQARKFSILLDVQLSGEGSDTQTSGIGLETTEVGGGRQLLT
jgi:hypothetical protein